MKKTRYFLFVLVLISPGIKAQNKDEKPIGIVPDSFKKHYGTFAKASMNKDLNLMLASFNTDNLPNEDLEEQKRIRLDYEKQKKAMALLDENKVSKTIPVLSNLPAGKKIYHKRVMKIVKRKKMKKCNCN